MARTGWYSADHDKESVSKTLEYAYDDWCIAQFAKMLNKPVDYAAYTQRAQYWKNVHNKDNGYMQAQVNGDWFKPFTPTDVNDNYVEGNAWQYTFLVPQDVSGLMNRMGGKARIRRQARRAFYHQREADRQRDIGYNRPDRPIRARQRAKPSHGLPV
jgi:putative alpha-1,2-mannosidase